MTFSSNVKTLLKTGRWRARRALTSMRWGADEMAKVPAVLGNAMPKSGSHLIIQVLQGLVEIGPFVNPGFPPINRTEDNRKMPDEFILANLKRMRRGDIAYGYVQSREPFLSALRRADRASIFVYRDPRDMIVSHVFYATEIHQGHGMHTYYTEKLGSMEERINAAIQGVDEPGAELSSVLQKYTAYLGWLDVPEILALRFEDLILDRTVALGRILDYLQTRGFTPKVERQTAIAALAKAIEPKRSGTFRKGKPGNWREHFTPANVAQFKEKTGNLLIRMGYETTQDW